MTMNMTSLALEQSKKRVLCPNAVNGYAYMSCVITGKATQRVLWERYKPLQC
jgi:hypothetical protein